jgi:hypothetical protein
MSQNSKKEAYLFFALLVSFYLIAEVEKFECKKNPSMSKHCLKIKQVNKHDDPPEQNFSIANSFRQPDLITTSTTTSGVSYSSPVNFSSSTTTTV